MFDLNPHFHNNSRHRYNDDAHFRLETMEEASGVCSPPLWGPPDSPVDPRTLSPSSKARAIAKGRRELMEMVENMPETSYELSLKDLVEERREFNDERMEERSILRSGQTGSRKKNINQRGRIIMIKNSSLNNNNNNNKGLLINMFFPFSIGSKKRKTSVTTNSSPFLSPKTELSDRRDWWWKKFTGSGDSESLGITSSGGRSGSSGSSGSSASGSLHSNGSYRMENNWGCWPFFPSRKKKVTKLRDGGRVT